MPQALIAPDPVCSYSPQIHRFRVILRDRYDQEVLRLIQTDSDRFCNVLATIQTQFPGLAVVDSWELVEEVGV